ESTAPRASSFRRWGAATSSSSSTSGSRRCSREATIGAPRVRRSSRSSAPPRVAEPSLVAAPELYGTRFSAGERRAKDAVWQVLCQDFFQRWVPADAVLIDLGAGFCEFVNHIRCRERWAVETDPRAREMAAPGVQVHAGSAH